MISFVQETRMGERRLLMLFRKGRSIFPFLNILCLSITLLGRTGKDGTKHILVKLFFQASHTIFKPTLRLRVSSMLKSVLWGLNSIC